MIEVKHLTKRYGSHTAVSDLSFTVEKGQIYGFLGPERRRKVHDHEHYDGLPCRYLRRGGHRRL